MALGMCNMLCSFFSGYPVTGSFARTAVLARMISEGAKREKKKRDVREEKNEKERERRAERKGEVIKKRSKTKII